MRKYCRKHCRTIWRTDFNQNCSYAWSDTKSEVQPGVLQDNNGIKVEVSCEVSEELNNYFPSVFTVGNIENMPEPEVKLTLVSVSTGSISTLYGVGMKLSKLGKDKANSADDIAPMQ